MDTMNVNKTLNSEQPIARLSSDRYRFNEIDQFKLCESSILKRGTIEDFPDNDELYEIHDEDEGTIQETKFIQQSKIILPGNYYEDDSQYLKDLNVQLEKQTNNLSSSETLLDQRKVGPIPREAVPDQDQRRYDMDLSNEADENQNPSLIQPMIMQQHIQYDTPLYDVNNFRMGYGLGHNVSGQAENNFQDVSSILNPYSIEHN